MNYIYFFLLSVTFFFIGCGTSNSSVNNIDRIDETNTSVEIDTSSINFTFPQKIAINIPLYIEGNSYRLEVVEDSEYDYKEVLSKIFEYRDKSDELEFNVQLIQKVFSQVEFYCSDLVINEICKIPKNTFSIKLTKPELRVFKKKFGTENIIDDTNRTLYMGKIEMLKEENALYDYLISVDISELYRNILKEESKNLFFENHRKKVQSLYWNKEKNYVYAAVKDSYSTYEENFKIENSETKDGKKIIHAFLFSNELNNSRHETITWKQSSDINSSYSLEYVDNYRSGLITFTKEGSQFHGSFFYNNAQHINFLNDVGRGIGSYSCPSFFGFVRCFIDNKSTWSTGTQIEDNATTLDKTFPLYARNIIDSNSSLSDGEYVLVAPEYKSQEEILKHKVASFMVEKHYAKGTLYNKDFVSNLSTYKIFRAFSVLNDKINYKEIRLDEYPNFKIQNVYNEE